MTAVHLNPTEQVYALSYVVGAALISFLFAYLFF